MRKTFFFLGAVVATIAVVLCFGDDTIQAPSTNTKFPNIVSFQHNGQNYILHATGAATRTKFFVSVYSVAHYMRHPVVGKRQVVFDEILKDNQTKQLTLVWSRDLDLKTMEKGFQDSFKKVLKAQSADIQKEMDQFFSLFDSSIEKGDVYDIRWYPGGLVEIEVNGQKRGEIKSDDFARTLWSVYFGPKSVVSRNRLISHIKAK